MKKIVILGSTGSIGSQTLDVIRAAPSEFQVIGLSAHENTQRFEEQVREFQPLHVVQTSVTENPESALCALVSLAEADIVVNALAGFSGLMPTIAAVKAGKRIALANKESLVMAGELIMKLAAQFKAIILPIDSEPSAIWQAGAVVGAGAPGIEKVTLTASGGPFWKWKNKELEKVTAAQAIKHPTWKMGEKISIDSATLINKAFEIIETRWLFNMPLERIDVAIHRQSLMHALVHFNDGNVQAVLSTPDMRIPISYALFYNEHRPVRRINNFPRLDFSELQLTFEKPDMRAQGALNLGYEVLAAGGIAPAVFCLSDEVAVNKFLKGEISFLGIYEFIRRALDRMRNRPLSIEVLNELAGTFNLGNL